MKINKQIISLLFILTATLPTLYAQQLLQIEAPHYLYYEAVDLWKNTRFSAGMTASDSLLSRGQTQAMIEHTSGSFFRVQEPKQKNQLSFRSEQYQQIGKKIFGYGSFSWFNGREKERAWSDVYRSYNTNPYFSGSSIKGKYDYQNIDIVAAISTAPLKKWRYGMRIDYRLGDFSRLKDPRSRSNLLHYTLNPSVVYTLSEKDNHHVGVAVYYSRRKEKIANITTVQSDATMTYYLFSGMENVVGTQSGFSGYNREWVDHRWGIQLAHHIKLSKWHALTTAGIERGSEGVYGTYKYQPGKYYGYRYSLQSKNRIYASGGRIHQVDFSSDVRQEYANEYRQELVVTTDPTTGYNSYRYNTQLELKKRYQVQVASIDLKYQMLQTKNNQTRYFLGGTTAFDWAQNRHLLNASSLRYSSLRVGFESGAFWFNNQLQTTFGAQYQTSLSSNIYLYDSTTPYAQEVLISDMEYYQSDFLKGKIEVTYYFPMVIKKSFHRSFLRLSGELLSTTNTSMSSKYIGVAVGLLH